MGGLGVSKETGEMQLQVSFLANSGGVRVKRIQQEMLQSAKVKDSFDVQGSGQMLSV